MRNKFAVLYNIVKDKRICCCDISPAGKLADLSKNILTDLSMWV